MLHPHHQIHPLLCLDKTYNRKESVLQMRPNLFQWTSPKVSGETFNLTADEWNGLLNAVNDVRQYKELRPYKFTTAVKGEPFKASLFNEARTAIQEMTDEDLEIPVAETGMVVTASMLNLLVEKLNKIE